MVEALLVILAAGLVLLLPGWAVLSWLPGEKSDVLSRLADAIGLSISITVLLGLVGFLAGIRLPPLAVAGGYSLFLLLAVAGSLRKRQGMHFDWFVLLGLLFVAALITWRIYQAHTLALPAWVDSVHHTLVVRKIMLFGGLPSDLGPEVNVPFFYHFGFHLVTALVALFASLEPYQAVLWVGQGLNALVALSIYRLGVALWNDRGRAGLAGLLVGFVFQMPAYYITWGRYTLLTGLVLLPLAMAAALDLRHKAPQAAPEGINSPENPEPSRFLNIKINEAGGAIVRLVLLTAGVCLSHYLAALLLALFLVILGLAEVIGAVRRRDWKDLPWRMALPAILGALLALPWLLRLWLINQGVIQPELVSPLQPADGGYVSYLLQLLGPRRSHILLIIAGVGLVRLFFQKGKRSFAFYALVMAVLTLPWGIRLGPFRPDYMAIMLFLPASLLVSDLLFSGCEAARRKLRGWVGWVLLGLATVGWLTWGIIETRDILNPVTVFTDQADVAALQWVQKNTPENAHFFINVTPWQYGVYRGIDGGYWLEPFSGRQSLIPPVIYAWGSNDEISQINSLAERASRLTGCTNEFWELVRDAKLTHIYTRQGAGSLQPDVLMKCGRLRLVYQQQGVSIFEIMTR